MTEQETARWLLKRDNFLLLTHVRPDGDTLGSATALCLALQKLGKTAWMQPNPGVTEQYTPFLRFQWAPEGYRPDTIVSIDLADEALLPPGSEQFAGKSDLCIDHHPSNQRYARALCLDGDAAACGEVVYRLCRRLGVMNEDIACALYVAISTDCGCFVYSNVSPETHRIAAALLEQGNFMKAVNKRFFQTRSRRELLLQGKLLSSMEFFFGGQVTVSSVTLADKADAGATDADCGELSSFAITMEGVRCAAFLRELEDGSVKVSVRSDEDWINASRVCARFGGGGHAAAAGGSFKGVSLKEARGLVLEAIRRERLQA